jgi:hypothetical protein
MREKVAAQQQRYRQASPAEQAELREQYRQTMERRKRLRELREQLRQAPPAERTMIRKEIRGILEQLEQARLQEKTATPNEGNSEVKR